MTRRMAWRQWAGISAVTLVVGLAFQGSRGLYDTTETRYATCAREMRESGHWLTPTLEYRAHWTKPPLTYWAIAAGTTLLGDNERGVRFYGSVAFVLTAFIVIWLGSRLFDLRTGCVAGLVYATAPFPVLASNIVSTDTLLTFWTTLAVACFVEASKGRRDRAQMWLYLMWLAFGLGFFTKGLAALVSLPALLIWNRRQPLPLRLLNPAALALFAGTAFWWYVAMAYVEPGLIQHLLQTEVLNRIGSTWVHNPEFWQAFTLYVPVLTVGLGLWLGPLFRQIWRPRLYHASIVRTALARADAGGLLLLWVVTGVGLYFLISSKLHLYVLPFVAPLALAVAYAVTASGWRNRKIGYHVLVSVGVVVGLKALVASCPHPHDARGMLAQIKAVPGLSPGAHIVQVNHRQEFGLAYYSTAPIERWLLGYRDPAAREKVNERLASLSQTPVPVVVVADRCDMPRLMRMMQKNGLPYDHHVIYAVLPGWLPAIPFVRSIPFRNIYDREICIVGVGSGDPDQML